MFGTRALPGGSNTDQGFGVSGFRILTIAKGLVMTFFYPRKRKVCVFFFA